MDDSATGSLNFFFFRDRHGKPSAVHPRISEIALFCDDVAATVAWYERLLGHGPTVRWRGGAVFNVGDVKLLVHERGDADPRAGDPPNVDHVAFAVDDVDATMDATGPAPGDAIGPRTFPWGYGGYVRDPDGRLVEVCPHDDDSEPEPVRLEGPSLN